MPPSLKNMIVFFAGRFWVDWCVYCPIMTKFDFLHHQAPCLVHHRILKMCQSFSLADSESIGMYIALYRLFLSFSTTKHHGWCTTRSWKYVDCNQWVIRIILRGRTSLYDYVCPRSGKCPILINVRLLHRFGRFFEKILVSALSTWKTALVVNWTQSPKKMKNFPNTVLLWPTLMTV